MLLCVNPYENPSTVMSSTLKSLTDRVLEELQGSRRTRTLVFRYGIENLYMGEKLGSECLDRTI